MRRVAPAIALFFLSPLVAEFLLGDFGLSALFVLVGLAPMYGGGAILIREVARRTGRGWPAMVLLALGYGVLEEGLTTQSLFNPDYLDAHLLDQGFVPALGIAIPWTIFVIAIHTIWSISVPIAVVEEWTDRRTTPWLRTPGIIVVSVIFAIGVVLDFLISYGDGHYLASWPKLAAAAIAVVLLVVAALRMPRRTQPRVVPGRVAPAPWLVFAAVLADGVLFMAAQLGALPAWLGVILLVLALGLAAGGIGYFSHGAGWGAWHRYAAAAGGMLTYAWHSFFTTPLIGAGPIMTPLSHIVFALAAVALLVAEARRIRAREHPSAQAAEAPAQAVDGPATDGPAGNVPAWDAPAVEAQASETPAVDASTPEAPAPTGDAAGRTAGPHGAVAPS
jgi:hypothetical protein